MTERVSQADEATRIAPRPASRVRRDIQGLRAIAVLLVLVYHLSPQSLTGGYIGVDVFFVISGFLITGQLLREMESSGRVDLPRFWARRAKRLLPAALLVLAVTTAAVWLLAPTGFMPSFLAQVAASAVYVQNWLLAGEAVDYMAAETQASPVQHFWTLSVEEQFYIVWPLVAVLALFLASRIVRRAPGSARPSAERRGGPAPVTLFAWLIGAVAIASFIASVIVTDADAARAYFVTTTRAWEFAAGGLLAWVVSSWPEALVRLPMVVRGALAWLGLAGIGASAILFSDGTAFPGYAALLPVLATVLVIAADEPEAAWSPRRLLAARPMQWLGDISYGIYLWHFPLIVLLPFALGRSLGPLDWLAVTAAPLLLAWASKELVEDPFRTGLSRRWPSGRTLVITSAGMAATLAVALAGLTVADGKVAAEREEVSAVLQNPDPCVGATALEPDSGCEAVPEEEPIPEPALADKAEESCLGGFGDTEPVVCEYGVEADEADRTIALVGDSHAEQWLTPLRQKAEESNWRLIVMAKASCPFTAAERDFVSKSDSENEALRESCAEWNEKVVERLEEEQRVDALLSSAKSTNRVVTGGDRSWRETAVEAYEERWQSLSETIDRVIVIRDTPQMPDDVLDCVTEHGDRAGAQCSVPEQDAVPEDPQVEAAASFERADVIDMTDYFVVDGECPPVIGGVLAFRDSHHLSWAYAEMLAEPLMEQVEGSLAEASG